MKYIDNKEVDRVVEMIESDIFIFLSNEEELKFIDILEIEHHGLYDKLRSNIITIYDIDVKDWIIILQNIEKTVENYELYEYPNVLKALKEVENMIVLELDKMIKSGDNQQIYNALKLINRDERFKNNINFSNISI